ncbi:MAG: zinc ribbon domain-containing protein [Clostridia bacterium]|nr:zinc ribbon domain-containing protein [Clostridia bacterium]
MFCGNCGNQIANEATFCPFCGNKTEHAPVTPVQPVYVAPVAPQPAPKKKSLAWLWILIGIIAAIAITIGVLFAIGVIGGNNHGKGDDKGTKNDPEAVAEAYIMAQLEGDIKTMLELRPGKYQKYYEEEQYGDDDDAEEMFEYAEEYADELDIDVEIDDFDQYYEAMKKITKAENEEELGKGYKFSVKVVDTKDMRNSDLENIQEMYDNDEMEDYINPDLIEEGMKVYVEVEVDGDEDSDSYVITVYTVKYDGHWKVAYTTRDDRDDAED